jgi:hypothetical protein
MYQWRFRTVRFSTRDRLLFGLPREFNNFLQVIEKMAARTKLNKLQLPDASRKVELRPAWRMVSPPVAKSPNNYYNPPKWAFLWQLYPSASLVWKTILFFAKV